MPSNFGEDSDWPKCCFISPGLSIKSLPPLPRTAIPLFSGLLEQLVSSFTKTAEFTAGAANWWKSGYPPSETGD